MDLHFNSAAPFTRWVVRTGALYEPFVVVDIGVQGGENIRWHLLGDYLIVHGFDAIEEVIEELRQKNRNYPNRHYHWLAAGNTEEERSFYFNTGDPYSSSFYPHGVDRYGLHDQRREQERRVRVRPLDALLAEGTISWVDFLKCDVEGFEKDVFLGARELLNSVLGIETETNLSASPTYPETHFGTLQKLLLEAHFLIFDLNFNRMPRASFMREVARRGLSDAAAAHEIGKPATFNVLFCRDLIDEADHQENYTSPCRPVSVDQLIKVMIIYELHGLSDVALDTATRFADRLAERLDVGQAVHLLADPFCRNRVRPLASPKRMFRQAANRALRAFRVNSRF
jgi:FkbM family methyltransferase